MLFAAVVLPFVAAQYYRFPDDQVYANMNGYTDRFFDWVGPGYDQGGSDWAGTCASGRSQSPIDIDETPDDPSLFQVATAANSSFTPIYFVSIPGLLEIQNNGYMDMYWLYSGTMSQVVNTLTINQVLSLITFQTPAEHTINGYRYPMSIVLGYGTVNPGGFGSFGYQIVVLVKEGAANPAIDQFINQQPFDIATLLPPSGVLDDYYFYVGSFANPVPDCIEGVAWVISNYVVEASRDQIAYFEDIYINDLSFSGGRGDVRDIQPLNGRTITHFIPSEFIA